MTHCGILPSRKTEFRNSFLMYYSMIQLSPRVNTPAVGTFYVFLSAVFFSLGGFMIKIVPWQSLSVSGVRSIFALITLLIYMKLITTHSG